MARPSPTRRPISRDGLAALLLLLMGLPTGCNSHPLRPADFSGRTPVVRVLIGPAKGRVLITADVPPTLRVEGDSATRRVDLPPGSPVTLTFTGRGWQLGAATIPGRSELTLLPSAEGSVRIDGRAYRGRFRFVPHGAGGAFDVVNDVDVENYLRGVLARELPPTFDDAAYDAQAVVARTYALYTVKTVSSTARYDLFADERSQVYGGVRDETPKALAAVERTVGEVVAYGPPGRERIFKSYFSSCCGGIGQSAADAFGDPPIPPLAAQRVGHLCDISPSFAWPTIVVPKAELTRRVRLWGTKRHRPEGEMALVRRITVAAENGLGRPVRFTITDAAGHRFALSGEEIRTAVNTDAPRSDRLPSSLFAVDDRGDAIAFVNGHGRGHGVGLCQYCAQARAAAGMDYKAIVAVSFPTAVVLRAY